MAAVEIRGVGDIEMAHEFGKIAKGRLCQKMIMIGHQDKAVDDHMINIDRLRQYLQEPLPVDIIPENSLPLIAPVGDVINSPRILDSQWSRHVFFYVTTKEMSRIKI